MNTSERNSLSPPPFESDLQQITDARTRTFDPSDAAFAKQCVVGEPVTEDLVAAIAQLEDELEQARLASESAERRLRFQRDQVDDELAAALTACRRLEQEKLAALGFDGLDDAEVFQVEPSSPASALTLIGLRGEWETAHRAAIEDLQATHQVRLHELESAHGATVTDLQATHQARFESQARELSQRYFNELQDTAVNNAQALQQHQAKAAEEARRRVEELAALEASHGLAIEAIREEISARSAEEAALRQQISALTSDLRATHDETAAANMRIHDFLSSTSWRASRPLRGVGRVLRWLGRR